MTIRLTQRGAKTMFSFPEATTRNLPAFTNGETAALSATVGLDVKVTGDFLEVPFNVSWDDAGQTRTLNITERFLCVNRLNDFDTWRATQFFEAVGRGSVNGTHYFRPEEFEGNTLQVKLRLNADQSIAISEFSTV